jgi:hypothetical protein
LDHFSYKNGPIDLVRGFFSSQDIGPCISSTCRPLFTFLGPLGVPQMTQNSKKNTIFWLFWTISPTRMGLLIWLGSFFQTKTLLKAWSQSFFGQKISPKKLTPLYRPYNGQNRPKWPQKMLMISKTYVFCITLAPNLPQSMAPIISWPKN